MTELSSLPEQLWLPCEQELTRVGEPLPQEVFRATCQWLGEHPAPAQLPRCIHHGQVNSNGDRAAGLCRCSRGSSRPPAPAEMAASAGHCGQSLAEPAHPLPDPSLQPQPCSAP